MENLTELVAQAEWLLERVKEVEKNVEELRGQLALCSEGLRGRLAELRPAGVRSSRVAIATEPDEPDPPPPAVAAPKPRTGKERRAMPRRKGNPVPVRVADPDFQGWVVDRSPDGLCLLADTEVAVGTRLRVSPAQQPGTPHWYVAEVRSCRPEGKNWVLGCRFTEELSWDDLRRFC